MGSILPTYLSKYAPFTTKICVCLWGAWVSTQIILIGWTDKGVGRHAHALWHINCDFVFMVHCLTCVARCTCFSNRDFNEALCNLLDNSCRSQWPRGLRRRSSAARLLRLWVRIPPEAWTFVVSVVCCQVEVSATDWSLVQRSTTGCGASLCVIKKPRKRGS